MKVNKRRGRRWWSIRIANICHFICGCRYFKKSHILRELHTNHKISNISQLWNTPVKMVTIQSWFEYLFLRQVKYRQRIPQLVKQVVINEMQKLTQNQWCEWKTLHTWLESLKSLTGQTRSSFGLRTPCLHIPNTVGLVFNSPCKRQTLRMMNVRPNSTSGILLMGISPLFIYFFIFIREPENAVYSGISGWAEIYIINQWHPWCL